jgi:hypothetical protein
VSEALHERRGFHKGVALLIAFVVLEFALVVAIAVAGSQEPEIVQGVIRP